MNYVAPSVETIMEKGLWPCVRRALPIIRSVTEVDAGWSVHGHLVEWREGSGWRCDCENWERHSKEQGGVCKHTLAVCLRSESYRARVLEASKEAGWMQ